MSNLHHRVRKADKFRALLTDVLPYETPIKFSNGGFYKNRDSAGLAKLRSEAASPLKENQWFCIPFTYRIKKTETESRYLSIAHPLIQLEIADFYEKQSGLIISLCSKSSWSLRAPSAVASYYVEKSYKAKTRENGRVEAKNTSLDPSSITASSYFSYRKYNFLYKFYESREFQQLERRYRTLLRLDISQCFSRIYTHTIGWAVKSRAYSKRAIEGSFNKSSFESQFDTLMQRCNYKETAGIIIGPEFSRIFAEIILQEVDRNIEVALSRINPPLTDGKDYTIRRYVDDYFIFTQSDGQAKAIQTAISDCLKEYKLSLNESKTNIITRPFITGETSARFESAKVLSDLFSKALVRVKSEKEPDKPEYYQPGRTTNPATISTRAIRDIKSILRKNSVTFDGISNYFFSTLRRLTANVLARIDPATLNGSYADWHANFLLAIIDIAFFFYSVSARVRQTYIISEIIYSISSAAKLLPVGIREKILFEAAQQLRDALTGTTEPNEFIERINLLFTLAELGHEYTPTPKELSEILGLNFPGDNQPSRANIGYFQIVAALYVSEGGTSFSDLRSQIVKLVIQYLAADRDWQRDTEIFILFLDLLSCPHLTSEQKTDIAKAAIRHKSDRSINIRARDLVDSLQGNPWFFDWSKNLTFEDFLRRKELRTPY